MKKVKKPNKKAKTPKTDIRIHRRITEQELLKKIDEDPDSVFTDFDVKYGVERLGKWCSLGDDRLKKNGKRILKKAGLTAYIPKSSRGSLKVYKEYPGLLLAEVKERANKLKEDLPKRAKSRREKLKAIQKSIDPKATVKSIGSYFPPKSRGDRTHIALGWIAYDNHVSFYTVLNLYEKIKKKQSEDRHSPLFE
jgi:hypothetical protein